MKINILTGKRFGSIVVVKRGPNIKGNVTWLCFCELCGTFKNIRSDRLKEDKKNCGCLFKTQNGLSGTNEYKSWNAMINRCYNKNNSQYKNYGERGIKVCKRWRGSFSNFLEDMGKKPSVNHSIDRINNNGDYSPENYRWATVKAQNSNKRKTILVSYQGKVITAKELSEILDIHYNTILSRIKKELPISKVILSPDPKHQYSTRCREKKKMLNAKHA